MLRVNQKPTKGIYIYTYLPIVQNGASPATTVTSFVISSVTVLFSFFISIINKVANLCGARYKSKFFAVTWKQTASQYPAQLEGALHLLI